MIIHISHQGDLWPSQWRGRHRACIVSTFTVRKAMCTSDDDIISEYRDIINGVVVIMIFSWHVPPLWGDPTKDGLEEDLGSPWITDVCVFARVVPDICPSLDIREILGVHLNNVTFSICNTNTDTNRKEIRVPRCAFEQHQFQHLSYKYRYKSKRNTLYQGVQPPVLSRPISSLHSKVQPDCE